MLKKLMLQKTDIETRMDELRQEIAPRMALLIDELTSVQEQIRVAIAEKLAELRRLQGKEFGVVNLVMDGYKIAETVSKKVTWDQTKLNELFSKIQASGDEPRNYMKLELKIGEKEYDKFAPGIKTIFADARTVTPGPASVKFEEVADA